MFPVVSVSQSSRSLLRLITLAEENNFEEEDQVQEPEEDVEEEEVKPKKKVRDIVRNVPTEVL